MRVEIADLYAVAGRVVPRVPPWVGYPLCTTLGAVLGPRLPAFRNVRKNLQVIMPYAPTAERERAARRVMSGLFKNYYDLFRFPTLSSAELAQIITFEHPERVPAALHENRGLIIVAPHCGNYSSIVPAALQQFDARALLVVEQMADPRVHEIINRMRYFGGLEIVPLGPTVGRTVMRALRQNYIVVLGGDRPIAENTLVVDFFGRPTPMPSGPATLALRTGAPLMPVLVQRRTDNSAWICFDPPLQFDRSESTQCAIHDVTQKIAYHMQAYIQRDPAQWMVAEDAWPDATHELR